MPLGNNTFLPIFCSVRGGGGGDILVKESGWNRGAGGGGGLDEGGVFSYFALIFVSVSGGVMCAVFSSQHRR